MSTLPSRFVADFGPHRGRMGDHGFGHPGLFVLGILLLAGVVTMAILLIRGSRRPQVAPQASTPAGFTGAPASPATSAELILSERFARGEVSVEDFVTARAALRGEWSPSTAATTSVATMPVPPVTSTEAPTDAPTDAG